MLGIIGGMGPEASCYFYENVIAHTKAEKDQEHIDMVLLSHASMPDRTEAIRTGDDTHLINLLCNDDVGSIEYCNHLQYIALFLQTYTECS